MDEKIIREDWDLLIKFFPEGWIEKANELGALVRKRKIDSAQTLMRVLLIHLADGKSLRTTATYAREAKLCNLNDTALLKRLKVSGDWLRWIALELLHSLQVKNEYNKFSKRFRIRLVDSTTITEPGSTGSDWRIHYALNLVTLQCDTFEVTDKHVGESFKFFPIELNDLILADRGYCSRKSISHVIDNGGDVLIRLNQITLPLKTIRKTKFNLLKKLRKLKEGEIADWDVYFFDSNERFLKGRLCAIRKSKEAIEIAKKKLRKEASKKKRKLNPETLELAEYVMVFTSVNRHKLKGWDVLLLYRGRWQIELAFKRMKSIIGIGHLPKFDPESCKAWLYGKLVVTLLVEHIYQEADFFSPWGYPLTKFV